MRGDIFGMALLAAAFFATACAPLPGTVASEPVITGLPPVGIKIYRQAARKFTAVVVTNESDVNAWLRDKTAKLEDDQEADGGSAAPVAPDGYFLTANHVLARSEGRSVYVVRRRDNQLSAYPARVVWRSAKEDLALLRANIETPDYYEWTPTNQWLPRGVPVMHAGVATGFRSGSGRLISAVPPQKPTSIKHDIPMKPGDSGGPLVDGRGLLVGINSAVEFLVPLETAFFIESEANRPDIARLQERISRDRLLNPLTPGKEE